MATDFWNSSDDVQSNGNYDVGGGDFPVIPDGTRVKAIIDKISWEFKKNYKSGDEENCISARFEIEEGEFKGQKIFKNFFLESELEAEQTKAMNMFFAVDFNAGGKIKALKRKPTDEELNRYLINKSMVIVVGMMEGRDGRKDSNYLQGVSSGKNKPAQQASKTTTNQSYDDMDDDIPF